MNNETLIAELDKLYKTPLKAGFYSLANDNSRTLYQLIKDQQAEIKALLGNIDNWVEYSEGVEAEIKRYREFVIACLQFGVVDATDCVDFDEQCKALLNPQEQEEI